jgi:hypothetical protein
VEQPRIGPGHPYLTGNDDGIKGVGESQDPQLVPPDI